MWPDDEVEVYIASALVRPVGSAQGEWVSIANYESKPVPVAGWKLSDRAGNSVMLDGAIPAGGTRVLRGPGLRPIKLPDTGGVLTMLDAEGNRIDQAD